MIAAFEDVRAERVQAAAQRSQRGSARCAMTALLELPGVIAAYGPVEVLHGVDFRSRRRGRGHPRRQRRRQDHHAPGDLPDDLDQGRHRPSPARTSPGASPPRSPASGVAHVPQGRGTFADLSVEDNLGSAPIVRKDKTSRPTSTSGTRSSRGSANAGTSWPAACRAASNRCSPWPGRMMSRPKLLLLDEPSLGSGADHRAGPVPTARRI